MEQQQQRHHQSVVVALLGGILATCLMNIKQRKVLLPAFNEGANGSLIAIMNTACAVGFGSVIKILPGFSLIKNALYQIVNTKSHIWMFVLPPVLFRLLYRWYYLLCGDYLSKRYHLKHDKNC